MPAETLTFAGGDRAIAFAGPVTLTDINGGKPLLQAPFSKHSWWNTPLPDATPLNPNNAAYQASIASQITTAQPNFNPNNYSAPIYIVPWDQPLVPVDVWCPNSQSLSSYASFAAAVLAGGVPIPIGVTPAQGTDRSMCLVRVNNAPAGTPKRADGTDPTDGTWDYWEFWNCMPPFRTPPGLWDTTHPERWHVRAGGKRLNMLSLDGLPLNANDTFAVTASHLFLASQIARADEFAAGQINHKVGLSLLGTTMASAGTTINLSNVNGRGYSWPATYSDGASHSSTAIPQGLVFRLPSDFDLNAYSASLSQPLSGPCMAMARAAQKYGMAVIDTAGAVGVRTSDPSPEIRAFGHSPYGDSSNTPGRGIFGNNYNNIYAVFNNFPWTSLVALPFDYDQRYGNGTIKDVGIANAANPPSPIRVAIGRIRDVGHAVGVASLPAPPVLKVVGTYVGPITNQYGAPRPNLPVEVLLSGTSTPAVFLNPDGTPSGAPNPTRTTNDQLALLAFTADATKTYDLLDPATGVRFLTGVVPSYLPTQLNIPAEIIRAEQVEQMIQTKIDLETRRAQGIENTLLAATAGIPNSIQQETARAAGQEQANAAALAAEIQRATGVEAGLLSASLLGVPNGIAATDASGFTLGYQPAAWSPLQNGWSAITGAPESTSGTVTLSTTVQTYVAQVVAISATPPTAAYFSMSAAGATLTANQWFVALCDANGNYITGSASGDAAPHFASNGTAPTTGSLGDGIVPLGSFPAVKWVQGRTYYVLLRGGAGTTMPTFNTLGGKTNFGLTTGAPSATAPRFGIGTVTWTSGAPASRLASINTINSVPLLIGLR